MDPNNQLEVLVFPNELKVDSKVVVSHRSIIQFDSFALSSFYLLTLPFCCEPMPCEFAKSLLWCKEKYPQLNLIAHVIRSCSYHVSSSLG